MSFGCRKLTTSTSARVTGHSRNSVTRGDCRAIWWNTRINPAKVSQIHANSEIERVVSAFDGTSSLPLYFARICFFLAALPRKDQGTGVTITAGGHPAATALRYQWTARCRTGTCRQELACGLTLSIRPGLRAYFSWIVLRSERTGGAT